MSELSTAMQKLLKTFDSLEGRWQDEKEYEDFNDYVAAAKSKCEELGLKFVKLTKSPFALHVYDGDTPMRLVIKSNKIVVETPAPTTSKENTMSKTQDLNALSLKQLAEIYNQHAEKKIKSFSGKKEDAIARVKDVLPKKAAAKKSDGDKPQRGSGARIRELLAAGKLTPAEIVEQIQKEFPGCRTSVKDVYWQRNAVKNGRFE